MSQDNNEAASAPEYCAWCAGEGVIHTGVDEAAADQCRVCEGTGMVVIAEAASASQSSTPVPRVGGPDEAKTIDTPEFRERLRGLGAAVAQHGSYYRSLVGYVNSYFLAHVARQRQESAAVAEGVDTVILQRLVNEYTHACEMVRGHAIPQWRNIVGFVTHACAQQREAGRREQMDRVRLMEGQRDIAQATCREFSKALDEAARARQPVSEGLTKADRHMWNLQEFYQHEPAALKVIEECRAVLALYAAPPAKAEGLTAGLLEAAAWVSRCQSQLLDKTYVATGLYALAQQAEGGK